jgi:general secretion pathway protein K
MLVVMAVLAVAVLEAARFSVARFDNQRRMEQARWYLVGAERFAAAQAFRASDSVESAALGGQWEGQSVTFPIDGGALTISVWDGSNCFNLNSLIVASDEGYTVASPIGQIEFVRLLELTPAQVFSGQGLAAALSDYLDTDSIPAPGGAEDSFGGLGDEYQTANTLMGDVSELQRVQGFSAEVVAALSPHVCTRPQSAPSVLNVNSLRREDAALLAAAFGEGLSVTAAEMVIASRPAGGWADVEAFLSNPLLRSIEVGDSLNGRFAVRPHFLVVNARVSWDGLEEASAALIEVGPSSRVVRRVFGPQTTERSV